MDAKAIDTNQTKMNRTEAAWFQQQSYLVRTGKLAAIYYPAPKLPLADNCTYTPDFMVIENNGAVRLDEVKGFWRDDARVKIKVAASYYPMFVFQSVEKSKSGWIVKRINKGTEKV